MYADHLNYLPRDSQFNHTVVNVTQDFFFFYPSMNLRGNVTETL